MKILLIVFTIIFVIGLGRHFYLSCSGKVNWRTTWAELGWFDSLLVVATVISGIAGLVILFFVG